MAQIEAFGALFRRGKQSLQPPPQVSSLADIRLGIRILAAQSKHSRGSGHSGEDLSVSFRPELDAFGQHLEIVVEVRPQPKLALLNFCRKSGPSIFTMRHISCNRERIRSPIRSPSVSSRAAARAGESDRATPAAGSSAKFVVMMVVRLSLYRVLRIRLTVSHTHSLGFTAPSSSSNNTSASNTGRSTCNSVAWTESL